MTNTVKHNETYPVITASDALYARAVGLIPAGTQTLAKGVGQWVKGVAPKFLDRGKGARVWDVDGNEYLDYNMAIGPVSLGYCYAKVDDAIRAQLERGITFSLVHPLEVEVAELVRDVVPNVQSVRFSKTGCDVTTAAVRLARAFTKKSKVLCCGYHGWHDWYISVTDRNAGIPDAVSNLTYTFNYNDLAGLEASIDADTACVILEPQVFESPKPGFLEGVREICDRNGALLIFDEMWTGFRMALGGAQARFGVRADLMCFSKAVANGMPISVLAGRRDVMHLLEKDVFFFTTFGGEALSLAAAKATIEELRDRDVPAHLSRLGKRLKDGYNGLATELGLPYTKCFGDEARTIVTFDASGGDPLVLKSFVQQEMLKRGVLWAGFHNLSFSHSDEDVRYTLGVYKEVLPLLKAAVEKNTVRAELRGEPVEPVFRKTSNFDAKPKKWTPMFDLSQKVAIVSGAVGLLGQEHCRALLEAGARVVLTDVAAGPLEDLAAKLSREYDAAERVLARHADITDRASLEGLRDETLRRWDRLDVLVNNAAINDKVEVPPGTSRELSVELSKFENYPLDAFRRSLEVNVTGMFLSCQVLGTVMAERKSGSIVNVASTYGLVAPDQSLYRAPDGRQTFYKGAAYPTTKGAVISFTKFLAAYWGGAGVRVNALCPGGVENGQDAHFVARYAEKTPLGRMAKPTDYRGAIVFLASDDSAYMTGSSLVVDGGWTAW